MIISNLTDLTFKVTNLYNSLNETIRINDCVDFTAKFYTDSLDLAAISYKHNDEIKNIKITETDDYCLINSSDLQKIGDGVISFYIEYSVEDSNFADGYYNNVIEGNTEYYVDLNINPFDNYYTKEEIDDKLDDIATGGQIDLSNYYKKSEIDDLLNNKVDISELANYYTKDESNSIFATKNELSTKLDTSAYTTDKETFATKDELSDYLTIVSASSTYQPKGEYTTNTELTEGLSTKLDISAYTNDKSTFVTVNQLSDYVTEEEFNSSISGKQDVLISGTNIKTINGNSLLGEGNIEIQSSESGISDAPNDGKKYVRQNQNWVEETVIDTSSFATKSEIPSNISQLTNDSGYITDEELISKDYATNTNLTEGLSAKLDTTVYTADKETFATKDEIPSEYVLPIASADSLGGVKIGAGLSINPETGVLSATGGGTADSVDWANITSKPTFANVATSGSYNDLSDKPSIPTNISELVNDSNYITNTELTGELSTKLDTSAYTNDKSTFATKDELSDYLTVSGASSTYQPKGDYVTNTELTEGLSTKLDTSSYTADKETFALKSEIPNVSNYITKDANNLTYYYTKTETDSKYATTSSIPTKVSQLTNDSNFISSIPSEYVTESELSAKNYATVTEVNNKIDKSQITFSTADPTGGSDGDIWFVYE